MPKVAQIVKIRKQRAVYGNPGRDDALADGILHDQPVRRLFHREHMVRSFNRIDVLFVRVARRRVEEGDELKRVPAGIVCQDIILTVVPRGEIRLRVTVLVVEILLKAYGVEPVRGENVGHRYRPVPVCPFGRVLRHGEVCRLGAARKRFVLPVQIQAGDVPHVQFEPDFRIIVLQHIRQIRDRVLRHGVPDEQDGDFLLTGLAVPVTPRTTGIDSRIKLSGRVLSVELHNSKARWTVHPENANP